MTFTFGFNNNRDICMQGPIGNVCLEKGHIFLHQRAKFVKTTSYHIGKQNGKEIKRKTLSTKRLFHLDLLP